jgi:hypothetical protein
VFHFEISTTWSYQMKKILVTVFACLSIASAYAENFSVEFINVGNFHIADIKSGDFPNENEQY